MIIPLIINCQKSMSSSKMTCNYEYFYKTYSLKKKRLSYQFTRGKKIKRYESSNLH